MSRPEKDTLSHRITPPKKQLEGPRLRLSRAQHSLLCNTHSDTVLGTKGKSAAKSKLKINSVKSMLEGSHLGACL